MDILNDMLVGGRNRLAATVYRYLERTYAMRRLYCCYLQNGAFSGV